MPGSQSKLGGLVENYSRWKIGRVQVLSQGHNHYSPADKKKYCDRVDQSMKLGMQVRFGIYNSIRRGAKKNCLIKTNVLKCEILINS